MFDVKSLTDDQVATIKSWVAEGAQLSDIQKKMEEELQQRLTYMDTRFLVLDLGLEIQSTEQDEPDEEAGKAPEEKEAVELTEDDIEIVPHDAESTKVDVQVSVDEITRPGVMVNGRVTFPDGESGMWYVDEMGRLGIDPDTAGYRPSEPDLVAFQKKLQQVVENR